MRQVKIFTGSSHPELTSLILERLALPGSPAVLKRFANAEIAVEIGESVRGNDVFIVQSGSSTVNDHVMELLIMIQACKSASARKITAVLPYYPYNKQSKKKKARGSITAKLLATMLEVAGVDHIITLDLHSSQIKGFFSKPVDDMTSEPVIAKYLMGRFPEIKTNGIMISKNAGGTKRVTAMADRLDMEFALIHREKYHNSEVSDRSPDNLEFETRLTLVGDVKGKICFILDDSIDGCHTFIDSSNHLKKCSADKVYVVACHGILSGNSLEDIEACNAIDGLIVTNSYPIKNEKLKSSKKIQQIDISGVLAEAIRRTHNGESISFLFNHAI